MWICHECKEELPSTSGTTTALLIGNAICQKCGAWNDIPRGNVSEEEVSEIYGNCAIWKENYE